jgi:hypothetical protein
MITLYEKGRLSDYNGGQPPNPRDFPLYGQKHAKERAEQKALPHVSVTSFGAQVASQHSPILRTGSGILSKSVKITSKQPLKNKTWRVKTAFGNWIKIDRIIHPILTLNLSKKLS